MFNATEILIDSFVQRIREGYRRTYGGYKPDYEDIIAWAGGMALENIANSDALYHNVEHSILVALVGQEILRGRHIREGGVSCEDWLHFILSLVCHDIGYVKGVCRLDRDYERLYATGQDAEMVSVPRGSSDASLTPYHVDRAKLFIEERFGGHKLIDAELIKRNIELTRFPVPKAEDHQDTVNYPGLVRASDLIGQLSDPRYLKKIGALYYEFEETGVNQALGYRHPGDLRRNYPKFYWHGVFPYIQDALRYLSLTQQGKQIIANLYSNVFVVEHESAEDERRQLEEQLVVGA
ncbi:metal-dependent phosphohydrolase [Coleofasciculus sp. FACHB-64]|uniref:Npun_R2479 family HD domain-containing metalloprotein n=1 Tax=Cyanophyceae TaxID=3028117 RepID=UPI00168744F6|nr:MULTISPECIES: Npun_R2479 family HD domain-containing metalloprotein [unclassified Coleofasciculus]MBD1841252.1 metal-dependent phosphohydrolase [Coleofasciculus sp. FACHB-501]MBD1882058.1 metal-dependent phosphohydrolase [Coleofasciculus sp. FACHB-T130]MBD1891520.1 metal-dependent phosphohydrolase [Coleofasciculus sp. FACHB-SPT9]MBD1894958.1 metal-dependent phosphohydrolase [Coleofasciculus sp. FACHB-129]MBD1901420.1 metal-dependent phosphohydrolase [Coleofasciculus sp. FACHB-125]